jgi:hypothetical protein
MPLVAGIDFGTLSARVSIFEKHAGRLGFGTAEIPLYRDSDPDFATQKHEGPMAALEVAMHSAIAASGVAGETIEAIAIDARAQVCRWPTKSLRCSATTISGAIIAPGSRPKKSPQRLIAMALKLSAGAAASTSLSGAWPMSLLAAPQPRPPHLLRHRA